MRDRSRRAVRMADLIRQELGLLLEHEVKDPRVGFATVVFVEMSPDLQRARVVVSIPGNEEQRQQSLEGLQAAQNFLRYQLAHRLGLRHVPTVSFHLDRCGNLTARSTGETVLRRLFTDSQLDFNCGSRHFRWIASSAPTG